MAGDFPRGTLTTMNTLSLATFWGFLALLEYSQGAIIAKCINHREDKVTFNCPPGHVIYRPIFYAGVSNSSSCFFQDGDCIGLTGALLTQRNKCYWRQSCSMRWRSKLNIVSSRREECMGKLANYVNYANPTCVPKENIYDICSPDSYSIKSTFGVIRSHSDYPWSYEGIRRDCRRTLKPRSGHVLLLTLDDLELETDDSDYLTIRHAKMNSDNILLYNAKMTSRKRWLITEGFLEIIFTATFGVKSASGFSMQFEHIQDNKIPLPNIGHSSNDVAIHDDRTSFFSNSQFKENMASLDECIGSKEKSTSLFCPEDHVIYKPELQVGVSNFDKCMYMIGDCMGMTHTLLTQRNKCYWKNHCELSWRSGIPITLSPTPTCLAMAPTYLSLSGFSCIPNDQVFDMCDKSVRTINATYGLIKSHVHYPWHYNSKKTLCRKRIQIHRKLGLRMTSEDFDLDPDSRKDNVKIFTVSESGKRRRVRKFIRNQYVDLTITDGCVDVEFRVDRGSKGGRGFVLKLEPAVAVDVVDDDFYTCPVLNKRRSRQRRRKYIRTRKNTRTSMKSRRRKTPRRRNKPRKERRGRKYLNNRFNEIHNNILSVSRNV